MKTFGKFLFRTPFLPIFFPGGGGRFVRVIKMVRMVRVVRILGGRDGWVGDQIGQLDPGSQGSG